MVVRGPSPHSFRKGRCQLSKDYLLCWMNKKAFLQKHPTHIYIFLHFKEWISPSYLMMETRVRLAYSIRKGEEWKNRRDNFFKIRIAWRKVMAESTVSSNIKRNWGKEWIVMRPLLDGQFYSVLPIPPFLTFSSISLALQLTWKKPKLSKNLVIFYARVKSSLN